VNYCKILQSQAYLPLWSQAYLDNMMQDKRYVYIQGTYYAVGGGGRGGCCWILFCSLNSVKERKILYEVCVYIYVYVYMHLCTWAYIYTGNSYLY